MKQAIKDSAVWKSNTSGHINKLSSFIPRRVFIGCAPHQSDVLQIVPHLNAAAEI